MGGLKPLLEELSASEFRKTAARRRLAWLDLEGAEMRRVESIVDDVRRNGDDAVLRYTRQFDGVELEPAQLRVTPEEIEGALRGADEAFLDDLREARSRIEDFHQRQLATATSWFQAREDGSLAGQLVRAVGTAGVYVPGGTAAYPSSVLMTVIPPRVAGVKRIVLCTPPGSGSESGPGSESGSGLKSGTGGTESGRGGAVSPYVLAAAAVAGVDEIYRIGGVQAVASMAYGTETVPRVDVIAGPGNIWVTLAKKLVFGQVGIDLLAGPSEVAILADEEADPAHAAADLLAQAEHDPLSWPILVTDSAVLAGRVREAVAAQLADLPRREVAAESLASQGAVVLVSSLDEGIEVLNEFAPEHLELLVRDPWAVLGRIESAGAIFVGPMTPEVLGDYVAGPNHVLPTGGAGRFASPLGVGAFLKRINVLYAGAPALAGMGGAAMRLARLEGLEGHARAVEVRLGKAMNGGSDDERGD